VFGGPAPAHRRGSAARQFAKWAQEQEHAGLPALNVGAAKDRRAAYEAVGSAEKSFSTTKQIVDEKRKLGIAPINFGPAGSGGRRGWMGAAGRGRHPHSPRPVQPRAARRFARK
jgi:hypothetical protein